MATGDTISGCTGYRSRCLAGLGWRSSTSARLSFPDSPLLTTLAARSVADSGTIRLPFGTGRTSSIASDDVARVVAIIVTEPGPYVGRVFEPTGPRPQDMNGVAEEYARALSRPVTYVTGRPAESVEEFVAR